MLLTKSSDVQEHIIAFLNLLVVILKRRALFRVFEKSLHGQDAGEVFENDFVSYYITDYTRGQLIDLRKVFETDPSSYKITDLINYVGSPELEALYDDLKKIWKEKFKDQVDKLIAHLDRKTDSLIREVEKVEVDEFIDSVDKFMKSLINCVKGKGLLILQEELLDQEGHFLKVDTVDDFKTFLDWSTNPEGFPIIP